MAAPLKHFGGAVAFGFARRAAAEPWGAESALPRSTRQGAPSFCPGGPMQDANILLVLDDSEASRTALDYVADLLGRRRGFRVCLGHVLPPVPPRLLEFGGSEQPAIETAGADLLAEDRQHWLTGARDAALASVNHAKTLLRTAGIAPASLDVHLFEPSDGQDTADGILQAARDRRCRTVVLGRQAVSWFRSVVQGDLAEDLMRRGVGFTFWIVE
jgi:nucleotide-binding universal stress UspA family protein